MSSMSASSSSSMSISPKSSTSTSLSSMSISSTSISSSSMSVSSTSVSSTSTSRSTLSYLSKRAAENRSKNKRIGPHPILKDWMIDLLSHSAIRFDVEFKEGHNYDPVLFDAILMIMKFRRDIAMGHFQLMLPYIDERFRYVIYCSCARSHEACVSTVRIKPLDLLGYLSRVIFMGFVLFLIRAHYEYTDTLGYVAREVLRVFMDQSEGDGQKILLQTARELDVDTVRNYFSPSRLSRRVQFWHFRFKKYTYKRYLTLDCIYYKCSHRLCFREKLRAKTLRKRKREKNNPPESEKRKTRKQAKQKKREPLRRKFRRYR